MKHVVSTIATVFLGWLLYLWWLPALNFESGFCWFFVGCCCAIFALCETIAESITYDSGFIPAVAWIAVVIIAIAALGANFFSGRLVNHEKYASMIEVSEKIFAEDMVEEEISSIAAMDSASARKYGDRTLTNPEWVSQFKVAHDYSQIALNGEPMKVAPLEHAGFVKALKNQENGIPAYVMVNPVTYKAEMVELSEDETIIYSPSGVWSYDLTRHIRKEFKTEMLGLSFFEIDEEGHPYWITQVMDHTIGLFGGETVKGVILTDAHSGDMEYYEVSEVPEWVDIVFDGDLICRLYDWHGTLQGGYLNSIFAQKNCKVTTDDFGYKVIGDDVFIYTGVTSVTADESNIGFILVNSRTLEYTYYGVGGAEEYSAMAAAEGEVQQYGYKASFPSLINVNGQPTYFMVLKDDNGLVKKYAMVNIAQYDVVAVADTIAEVSSNYKKLMASRNVVDAGEVDTDDMKTVETTISAIEYITVEGETVVYVKTESGVFKSAFEESYMLLEEGQSVTISYFETGADIEYISVIQ